MPINPSSYSTLFISEETLKQWSLINENVSMDILRPTIRATQELELMKILGTSLYADLQTKISANTLNVDELSLMIDYIEPVMIWGIMKRVGYYLSYRYSNKGVQTMSSDNSQPVPKDVLNLLSNDAQNNFNQYCDMLMRHLRANSSLFPAYGIVANQDDLSPLREAYSTGFSLDMPVRNTINGDVIRRQW